MSQNELKASLLEQYAEQHKRPINYYQIDSFANSVCDSCLNIDGDDDAQTACATTDLRMGGIPVRVQIERGTSRESAIRLLRKSLELLERDAELLAEWRWATPYDAEIRQHRELSEQEIGF